MKGGGDLNVKEPTVCTVFIHFVPLSNISSIDLFHLKTENLANNALFRNISNRKDLLCGLVVRVLGYRSGGPGSIPGTTRKKK
jgi:hypothetical protein